MIYFLTAIKFLEIYGDYKLFDVMKVYVNNTFIYKFVKQSLCVH